MEGIIFDIARCSFVDGPGIRTTVFFKGCNLRCRWCHNPESQKFEPQTLDYGDHVTQCGKKVTVDEVFAEILQDKPFYGTDGGATFSGGECLLQPDFLTELLKMCKANGIGTAVDTAGCVDYSVLEKVMPLTDIFLYDIKSCNAEKHKAYIGADNARILDNFRKLSQIGARIWVRVPIIPRFNNTEEDMYLIKQFIDSTNGCEKVELLPYHRLGENKYRALGKEPEIFEIPEDDIMQRLRAIFR